MSNDRRSETRGEDRRIIQRYSNASIKECYTLIERRVRFVAAIVIAVALVQVYFAFNEFTPDSISRGFFRVVFLIIPAALLWQYSRAVKRYLTNESSENLTRSIQEQVQFWTFFGIVGFVFTVIYILFSF